MMETISFMYKLFVTIAEIMLIEEGKKRLAQYYLLCNILRQLLPLNSTGVRIFSFVFGICITVQNCGMRRISLSLKDGH